MASQQAANTVDNGPSLLDREGLCLLSLDGGGVRGLSSLRILKALMRKLNHERERIGLPRVKPCDIFDLIAGTSTGGIIAIMLGRLEMDVDECIEEYEKLIGKVFKKAGSRINFRLRVKGRFKVKALEEGMKNVLKDRLPSNSDAEPFNDTATPTRCRVFVCALSQETRSLTLLRSYSVTDGANDHGAEVWQAALATSAATTFFDPVTIQGRVYVDGGLAANNPVDELEKEAANIWCPRTGNLKPLVKCFLSIGTGNPGSTPIEEGIWGVLSRTMVNMATETENTAENFHARWRGEAQGNRYFRFNVSQGLQTVGLDEFKKQGTIKAATDDYVNSIEHRFIVQACVDNLKQKRSPTNVNFEGIMTSLLTTLPVQGMSDLPKALRIVPFDRHERLVGRQSELQKLQDMLEGHDYCSHVALVGLGGVGKSRITLEYAYLIRDRLPDCSVFWVPAITTTSFELAYLQIGQALQIPGINEKTADVKLLVKARLTQEIERPWLMIVDNADDSGLLYRRGSDFEDSPGLANYLPSSCKGSILFTTRSMKAADKQASKNVVKIREMNEAGSREVLKNRLRDESLLEDEPATVELLDALAYLPLAIVQAAAFLNENSCLLSDYLKAYRESNDTTIELLSKDFEDRTRYSQGNNAIATTWLISFQQIQRQDPLAAEYLSFMGCIERQSIPHSLLPSASAPKALDAIGTLKAYAFLTEQKEDRHENFYDLHRLVHLATLNWLKSKEILALTTRKTLEHLAAVFPKPRHENRAIWKVYLPHAIQTLELKVSDESQEAEMTLLYHLCLSFGLSGQYYEAERRWQRCLELNVDIRGREDPHTAVVMADFAKILVLQSKLDRAGELAQDSLELLKANVGLKDRRTIESLTVLASVRWHEDKLDISERLLRQAQELGLNVLGREDEQVLIIMNDLALVLKSLGKLQDAEDLHRQTLTLKECTVGLEHPESLTSMSNLAILLVKQGKTNAAKDMHEQVLRLRKKVLGEEHPMVLDSKHGIAYCLRELGDYVRAEEIQRQIFETRKRLFGSEHLETCFSMHELAAALGKLDRFAEAEELLIRTVTLRKKSLGPAHKFTLASIHALANTMRRLGRWQEVEELYRQTITSRKEVLGSSHPDTLMSMHNLAFTFGQLRRWQEAEELYRQTIISEKEVLGPSDSRTLKSIWCLAKMLSDLARPQEAEALCLESLKLLEETPESQSEEALDIEFWLAVSLVKQKRYTKAAAAYQRALTGYERILGPTHEKTLACSENLAIVQEKIDEKPAASVEQSEEIEATSPEESEEYEDTSPEESTSQSLADS